MIQIIYLLFKYIIYNTQSSQNNTVYILLLRDYIDYFPTFLGRAKRIILRHILDIVNQCRVRQ